MTIDLHRKELKLRVSLFQVLAFFLALFSKCLARYKDHPLSKKRLTLHIVYLWSVLIFQLLCPLACRPVLLLNIPYF